MTYFYRVIKNMLDKIDNLCYNESKAYVRGISPSILMFAKVPENQKKGECQMKRLHYVISLFIPLALFLFCLAGCEAKTSESVPPSDSVQEETGPVRPDSPILDLGGKSVDEITAREVVDDYLAGSDRLVAFRSVPQNADEGWLCLKVPSCQTYKINTNYIYPSEKWTPEEIVASYLNDTAPWRKLPDGSLIQAEMWSEDCNYHFEIRDGWLYINGHKNQPFACKTTASIDPMDLLKLYQAGEWDGREIYSEDYSTSARINGNGTLSYWYENPACLSEDSEADPVYVYAGCAEHPWWRATEYDYEVEIGYSHCYGKRLSSERATVDNFYLDLPEGIIGKNVPGDPIKHSAVDHRHGQTRICTTAGIYVFQAGKMLDAWRVDIDAVDGYLHDPNWDDQPEYDIHLYTGNSLLKLRDDGKYDVCVAETAGFYTGYEGYSCAYFIENGALKRFNIWMDEESVETVLPGDVVAAAGFNEIFVQMGDGYTYYLGGFVANDKEAYYNGDTDRLNNVRLGTEPPEYYDTLWREFDKDFYSFLKSCNPLFPG